MGALHTDVFKKRSGQICPLLIVPLFVFEKSKHSFLFLRLNSIGCTNDFIIQIIAV